MRTTANDLLKKYKPLYIMVKEIVWRRGIYQPIAIGIGRERFHFANPLRKDMSFMLSCDLLTDRRRFAVSISGRLSRRIKNVYSCSGRRLQGVISGKLSRSSWEASY